MDEKSLNTLEYPKILERLAAYAAFSASAELALSLHPSNDFEEVKYAQELTAEARLLLSIQTSFSVGGVRDIRSLANQAAHGGVLTPSELQTVKNTLASSRDLYRKFEKRDEKYPKLTEIGSSLNPPQGLIDVINKAISDDAKVLDNATPKLATLRSEIKVKHQRLISRLEKFIQNDRTIPMLQESLITQRNGRYVIPLRSEFKGQIKSIIHDQSSSGATLFIEPLEVVELTNEWLELQIQERNEVQKILAALSAQVGSHQEQLSQMIDALARLDLALMCAKYAEDLDASEPVLQPLKRLKPEHPGSVIKLYKARHPLLPQEKAVPINVVLDPDTFSLIITGPNTGGKTVTLKTIGLLVLMAQSGLHIPVLSGSGFTIFKNVFADIGDEQSIEQSLSTFSGHITNIIRILEQSRYNTLVLFDELGAGTDPQDGAALAQGILTYLMEHKIPNMVATHYPELKTFAHNTPGTTNACMDFDLVTLRPTYNLTIGLPGRSNALLIAERLGLKEEIIKASRAVIKTDDIDAESLLEDIRRQKDLANQENLEVQALRKELEVLRAELKVRLDNIDEERRNILEEAHSEAEDEFDSLLSEIRELQRDVKSKKDLLPMKEKTEEIKQDLKKTDFRKPLESIEPKVEYQIGERVRLRSLGMNGVITAVNDEDIEIQAGALRMRAKIDDLQRINKSGDLKEEEKVVQKKTTVSHSGSITTIHPSPGIELDLRGQRIEEAMEILEKYLEDAYLAGLPFVRIIHGKGTGRLRKEVRQVLRRSDKVKSWVKGLDGEGGEGVSVAHMLAED